MSNFHSRIISGEKIFNIVDEYIDEKNRLNIHYIEYETKKIITNTLLLIFLILSLGSFLFLLFCKIFIGNAI